MKSILCASLALVAGAAFAGVGQDFESTNSGLPTASETEKWVGNGTVTAGEPVVPTIGSPMSESAHTKLLAVDGTVSCSNLVASANSYSKADFLLFVDEAGDDPEDVIEGAQIAVAAGEGTNVNNSCIWVYCKNGSPTSSNAWFRTDVVVPTQTWARVTLNFDYTNARCQVSVNGEAANSSSAGYVKSSENTFGGSWYPVISSSASKLSELTFVGSTKVDDVLICESGTPITRFTGGVTVGDVTVPYDYLANYSIKTNAVGSTVTGSGLTVAQKYEAGLDPTDDSTFTATSIVPNGDDIVITIPCAVDNSQTYEVYCNVDGKGYTKIDSDSVRTGDIVPTTNTRTLTFPKPDPDTGTVFQYQVRATKSSN